MELATIAAGLGPWGMLDFRVEGYTSAGCCPIKESVQSLWRSFPWVGTLEHLSRPRGPHTAEQPVPVHVSCCRAVRLEVTDVFMNGH